ncbi:MAG: metal-dependent hydrolase [Candidatus Carbobacillus sp.]|nr:metal-dependent hydrolase [Candidatus Carbobacillus sp.]
MDTGTHFIMGVGLFALAHIDPQAVATPEATSGLLLATVIGSQIPDIDTLSRLRGNTTYIRQHRGLSHSLPMLILYVVMISTTLSLLHFAPPFWHLLFWTALAVFIHAGTDILNSYGTQLIRPWRRRWIALDIINIIDPIILITHALGLMAWFFGAPPGKTFLIIYLFLAVYVLGKSIYHVRTTIRLQKLFPDSRLHILPVLNPLAWQIIVETPQSFQVGRYELGELTWQFSIKKREADLELVEKSKMLPSVQAFLAFTRHAYVMTRPVQGGCEVRWVDVRYFGRPRYPLMVTVRFNAQGQVTADYLGWESDHRVERRLIPAEENS